MTAVKVRSAVVLIFFQSYGAMVLQFIAIMVISRLLTPKEIGVFSIGAIIFSVFSYLRDLGIGTYITRAEHIDTNCIRSAMGLNMLSTVGVSVVLYLCAPLAASFYGHPGVADVLRVYALTCLVIGPGTLPMAMHLRQINLIPQFWVAVTQTVTSVTVSIILAVYGFSYMGLAYGQLAAMFASTIVCLMIRPKDFPIFPRFSGMLPIFTFGSNIVWINVLDKLGKGFPELVIARAAGIEFSALFSRGNGLLNIFQNVLEKITSSVTFPYYSKQFRDGSSLISATQKTHEYSLVIGWPFCIAIGFYSKEILILLFGNQWTGAAEYLQILSLVFAMELIALPCKNILIASNSIKFASSLQTATHAIRIALVIGASGLGTLAVCWSLVIAALANIAISFIALKKSIAYNLQHLLSATWSAAASSMGLALIFYLIDRWGEPTGILSLAILALFAFAYWLGSLFVLDHPLAKDIKQLLSTRHFPGK